MTALCPATVLLSTLLPPLNTRLPSTVTSVVSPCRPLLLKVTLLEKLLRLAPANCRPSATGVAVTERRASGVAV